MSTYTIYLTHANWHALLTQLKTEHPPSVFLIRERFKQVFGFVSREYRVWNSTINKNGEKLYSIKQDCIALDFYSEHKQTMFVLKYADYISPRTKGGGISHAG